MWSLLGVPPSRTLSQHPSVGNTRMWSEEVGGKGRGGGGGRRCIPACSLSSDCGLWLTHPPIPGFSGTCECQPQWMAPWKYFFTLLQLSFSISFLATPTPLQTHSQFMCTHGLCAHLHPSCTHAHTRISIWLRASTFSKWMLSLWELLLFFGTYY